ncbi:5-methylcytosine-specific restriction endonuclease McrA [Inquilinus ginsengisoli]|uniref:HNH endonuclease n=1 Tax=Inquilinus ginsengisoli TaxID=363840 RepID=UPI003D1F7AD0
MSETEGLRRCLLSPIPELDEAVDLLSEAADGLLAGNENLARDRIQRADMAAIHDWASRIMGSVDDEIHRYRPVAGFADAVAQAERAALRMPGRSILDGIYARDGYRCRFCGSRVVLSTARRAMEARLPGALRWGGSNREQHAAFFALTATVDHLVPHSRGGDNDPGNLLTTCQACNFGRNDWLIEEVSLIDPRNRPPLVDGWDGLKRLTVPRRAVVPPIAVPAARSPRARTEADPTKAAEEQARWLSSLERASGVSSERLLALLDSCRDLHVSWRLKEVLLVKVSVGGRELEVLGIEPTGDVQVPWFIGDAKDRFRGFAETLAAAIPGAVVYETPKMWRVKGQEGWVSVCDIVDAPDGLRAALRQLNDALNT